MLTSEAGGGADFVARLIAHGLSGKLGQQVIVDNQGGAGGIIAAQTVAKAAPDGHTLLLYSAGFWTLPLLQKVPYDPQRDFAPITIPVSSPGLIVVHPTLPAKSVRELIALAKARPGQLNYASGGVGSVNHLAAELFKAMAGVNIVRVAYKGSGPAQNDLMAGQVQLAFISGASIMPYVRAGRLKVLAVTSLKPSVLYPGVSTVDASGLPGYESISRFAYFTPAKVPVAVITRLHEDIVATLNTPDIKTKFFESGSEVVGSTPEQLAAVIKAEMARMGKVIADAGIRAD